jgi:hypothetical protein
MKFGRYQVESRQAEQPNRPVCATAMPWRGLSVLLWSLTRRGQQPPASGDKNRIKSADMPATILKFFMNSYKLTTNRSNIWQPSNHIHFTKPITCLTSKNVHGCWKKLLAEQQHQHSGWSSQYFSLQTPVNCSQPNYINTCIFKDLIKQIRLGHTVA